ncbi:acyl-CoA N-acyltransferase [Russula earlei]|uniref:Acyl-CoA N-acyltransferase n=1 Tax=Russula earlei TaxID=71964 RepID=A0ACC0U9K2_9AGAM|nr:acyl-CoA N-acyltransferase [Russula earlei]
MRVNAHTALIGDTVALVPYRYRYHAWMQSAELRALTASEELTLEQEYAMQRSWQEDEDKLTFIILARPLEPTPSDLGLAYEDIRALPMIGDVNLFFKHSREDPEFEVECEPAYRGQRRAHGALVLLLSYACDKLGVGKESFVARIGAANARSIALFASLGFGVVRTISVFDEVEMRVMDTDVAQNWPAGQVREYF